MAIHEIELDYEPRPAFEPFHDRTQRWACLVAHRRAGKTVSAINDTIRCAITSTEKSPLFGYVAPFRSQAKSVAWEYLKQYAQPITNSTNESELSVTLVNGAKIALFGADNADALRGLGFSGIYLDEYGDFKPSVFGNVIRPALSDHQGWAVFAGTPKGKNQFFDIADMAERSPDWFYLRLPASTSGLLPASELADVRAQLTQDQYDQEYECSFDAAILGAIFGVEMREATDEGRIRSVAYDPELPVHTAWDLGYRDDTAIWFYQVMRGEIRIIDFYAVSGATIDDIAETVIGRGYRLGKHYLPHDARAKTLASGGRSIVEQLAFHLGIANLSIVPDLGVQDGIQAARLALPRCYFDAEKCREGIEALRQYQREYDEDKKAFRQTPRHDWCFTGDTEILTRYGTCQIMNLPYSGEVLTSCGWKQYVAPRVTMRDAPVVEVAFRGGYSVRCTPDHLFKTASGWISAENLTKGTWIQSFLTRSRNISTAASTAYGRATNTFLAAARSYTETFGLLLSGQSLAGAISIIETGTPRTIDCRISSASTPISIYLKHGIEQSRDASISPMAPAQQRPIGINPKPAGCGIADTQSDRRRGLSGSAKTILASIAKGYSPLLSAPAILRNIVRIGAKSARIALAVLTPKRPLVIESVKKLNKSADVWCLTVPGAEEFSLANGALVHNCSHPADAFRMLSIAWRAEPPKAAPDPEPKIIVVNGKSTVTLNELWATSAPSRSARI